jgi:hypothetical protein
LVTQTGLEAKLQAECSAGLTRHRLFEYLGGQWALAELLLSAWLLPHPMLLLVTQLEIAPVFEFHFDLAVLQVPAVEVRLLEHFACSDQGLDSSFGLWKDQE